MIFDTLGNVDIYNAINPRFGKSFQYLRENDLAHLPVGRMDLEGGNLYVLVQEYTSKAPEQGVWEAHRHYIDIQYMVSGMENMGFASIHSLSSGVYIPERDFQPLSGEGNIVTVFPGSFVIFFPQDGHKPGLFVKEPALVRKVVFKVKIDA
jgi:YhcH/YjgK/YiaL family protein